MTLLDWLALWCVTSVVFVAIVGGVIGSADYHDETLTEAADQYEAWIPGTARLDQPPRPPRPARRSGADGRPA